MTQHRDRDRAKRNTSVRAEQAPSAAPSSSPQIDVFSPQKVKRSERPREVARRRVADSLDCAMDRARDRGHYHLSNRAIAERDLEVNEKHVRQLRDARKALTVAEMTMLHVSLQRDLIEDLFPEIALPKPQPNADALDAALEEYAALVKRRLSASDRAELHYALTVAGTRIGGLLNALGGKR